MNIEFNKRLGALMREEREKAGKTQQEIAERLGVTKTAVHQWESGKRNIYASNVVDYCAVIGIRVDDLFSRM